MYYDDKNYMGRDRLYYLSKKKSLGLTKRQVMDWLSKQDVHQRMQ